MAPSQNFEGMRPGGAWERSVEGVQVVTGQLDASGGDVLPNVGRFSGTRDSVTPSR